MAKNRFGIQFDGLEDMIAKLESVEGDIKATTEAALKASKQYVNPGIQQAIGKHHITGDTEATLDKSMNVTWDGPVASIEIGFKLPEGLPSIFLMYGTPRMKKDTKLYNSIYGAKTTKQVAAVQQEVFQKRIERKMGG